MINYINYTNKIGLTFSIRKIEEFTWMRDKYKGIFIDDIKYKSKVESELGCVPNNFDELIQIAQNNFQICKIIEDLFCSVYGAYDDSVTLLSDITKKNLYMISGTQINYDAGLVNLEDVKKIYVLNPEVYDYTDLFGHKISFHINNDFIN